jgi:hypothetical protein
VFVDEADLVAGPEPPHRTGDEGVTGHADEAAADLRRAEGRDQIGDPEAGAEGLGSAGSGAAIM